MKILIISKYASSLEVGFETRIFALSRMFAKAGHTVSIISSDSNHFGKFPKFSKIYNNDIISGINVIWIRTLKYYKTVSLRRVISWIDFELKLLFLSLKKENRPDVIIVSSLSLLTILNGIRLRNRYNAKLIFEIRDIWPLVLVEEGGYKNSNIFVRMLAAIEKYGYKSSDLIVGTMPNLKEHVKLVSGENLRCECIPFGFDAEAYFYMQLGNKKTRIEYKIPLNKFVVGYAGSIGISNFLNPFIDCVINLNNNTSIFFVILGDGALQEEYIKKTKKCSNILFIPKVPRNEVANILQMCDILYFSSSKGKLWDYGWSPNKLIDYMAAGKPVIASYSGYQSMLNEAGSGFFIPSEDTLALENEILKIQKIPAEILSQMGSAGRDWLIKNRTWFKLSEDYLNLMKSLISKQ